MFRANDVEIAQGRATALKPVVECDEAQLVDSYYRVYDALLGVGRP